MRIYDTLSFELNVKITHIPCILSRFDMLHPWTELSHDLTELIAVNIFQNNQYLSWCRPSPPTTTLWQPEQVSQVRAVTSEQLPHTFHTDKINNIMTNKNTVKQSNTMRQYNTTTPFIRNLFSLFFHNLFRDFDLKGSKILRIFFQWINQPDHFLLEDLKIAFRI